MNAPHAWENDNYGSVWCEIGAPSNFLVFVGAGWGLGKTKCYTFVITANLGVIQVLRNADGWGQGVRFSGKKRYEGAMLLALRGGWVGVQLAEKSINVILEWPLVEHFAVCLNPVCLFRSIPYIHRWRETRRQCTARRSGYTVSGRHDRWIHHRNP